MPLFIKNVEFKGEASQLSAALLNMEASELLSNVKLDSITSSTIQLFPRQAVFLDASSCYRLKDSSSFKHLNAVYLADFNTSLCLHIRSQDTSSYTAYIDPFTIIEWEKVFELFTANLKDRDTESLRFEIHLGLINIKNAPNYIIITQLINKLTQSLVAYLTDKPLHINFCLVHQLINKELLDGTNNTNLVIDTTCSNFTVSSSLNACFFPFELHPIDKHALTLRLFDYTNDNRLRLTFNLKTPAYTLQEFTSYCYSLSSEYTKVLSSYKKSDGYDLGFIIDYIKQCIFKLVGDKHTAQALFDCNLLFYMKNATHLFTAIKIFPEIIKDPVSSKLAHSSDKIPRQRSSESDIANQLPKAKPKTETSHTALATPIAPNRGFFNRPHLKKSNEKTKNTTSTIPAEMGISLIASPKKPS